MSIRAVLWALELAPVTHPSRALLLVALCERANDDGRGSWPTMEWLMAATRLTRSTVKWHLRALQDEGLIAPLDTCEDPRWLRLRPDRRPRPWALAVPGMPAPGGLLDLPFNPVDNSSRGVTGDPPWDAHGGSPVIPRGATGAQHGGSPVAPRHIEEEPEENRNREPERADARDDAGAVVIDLRGAAAARAAHHAARAHR